MSNHTRICAEFNEARSVFKSAFERTEVLHSDFVTLVCVSLTSG